MSQFRTSDGINLHYLDAGAGPSLVLLHGWSGSAALFKHQLSALRQHFRIIALDMRGHGHSEKPSYGYRISRLAKDLRELLEFLDLKHVRLLGHSAGCSVIWCYWDLYGAERISKLVLVDQHPVIVAHPSWTASERQSFGAILKANELYRLADDLAGPNGVELTETLFSGMMTGAISDEQKRWILDVALQFPRTFAAQLIVDVATHDWRDTIARLTVPTLIVSGRASQVPWQSQVWMQTQIAGSRLETFDETEGGRHFMFLEAPNKFNAVLADFLG
ncbi:MAG: alpha/beta hydrolase [Defluviicoccus sp.]|nr:MAG: alpha/beta hydrolase [Defluviicoccus sp.]